MCVRKGCHRARAQNPRTGELHDHCSLKCMRTDQEEQDAGMEGKERGGEGGRAQEEWGVGSNREGKGPLCGSFKQ